MCNKGCGCDEPALSVCLSVKNVTCNGASNGEITASVSGGVPPYTFSWDDPNNSITQKINGLSPRDYTLIVTDALSERTQVIATVTEPEELTVNVLEYTEPTGSANGVLDIEVEGGTPPYTYDLEIDGVFQGVRNWCEDQGCACEGDCSCGCSSGSNIYIAYADDENGTNFSLDRLNNFNSNNIPVDGLYGDEQFVFDTNQCISIGRNGSFVVESSRSYNIFFLQDLNGNFIKANSLNDSIDVSLDVTKGSGSLNTLVDLLYYSDASGNVNLDQLLINGDKTITLTLYPVVYNGDYVYILGIYINSTQVGVDLVGMGVDSICLSANYGTRQCYKSIIKSPCPISDLTASNFEGQWELINDSDCGCCNEDSLTANEIQDIISDLDDEVGTYTYIRYADDSNGNGFTESYSGQCYQAILVSYTEIVSPVQSDFDGLWTDECNANLEGYATEEWVEEFVKRVSVKNWTEYKQAIITLQSFGGGILEIENDIVVEDLTELNHDNITVVGNYHDVDVSSFAIKGIALSNFTSVRFKGSNYNSDTSSNDLIFTTDRDYAKVVFNDCSFVGVLSNQSYKGGGAETTPNVESTTSVDFTVEMINCSFLDSFSKRFRYAERCFVLKGGYLYSTVMNHRGRFVVTGSNENLNAYSKNIMLYSTSSVEIVSDGTCEAQYINSSEGGTDNANTIKNNGTSVKSISGVTSGSYTIQAFNIENHYIFTDNLTGNLNLIIDNALFGKEFMFYIPNPSNFTLNINSGSGFNDEFFNSSVDLTASILAFRVKCLNDSRNTIDNGLPDFWIEQIK